MHQNRKRKSGIVRPHALDLATLAQHATQPVAEQTWTPLPQSISAWLNDREGDCDTAEEMANIDEQWAYDMPDDDLQAFLNEYGLANGATSPEVLALMQSIGITSNGYHYTDGTAQLVNPANWAQLCSAIYTLAAGNTKPAAVKLDVDGDQLQAAVDLNLPFSIISGLRKTGQVNHDTHVCRAGTAAALLEGLNEDYGTAELLPPWLTPTTPCCVHFTWGQYQLIDFTSVANFAAQGYVRTPSSIREPA